MNHRSHQAQHASSALKLQQRGPVGVETIEHLGMDYSPHSVRTTVPSSFVTGLPGEILLPTRTTRFTFGGSFVTPASFKTGSMPDKSLGAVPENR